MQNRTLHHAKCGFLLPFCLKDAAVIHNMLACAPQYYFGELANMKKELHKWFLDWNPSAARRAQEWNSPAPLPDDVYWPAGLGSDVQVPLIGSVAMPLEVRFKKLHPDAKNPVRATSGSAGFDLTAVSVENDGQRGINTYHTGLAIEIPQGYVGLLFPRSSIYKSGQSLTNSVGVVDSDYRGEVTFKFRSHSRTPDSYKAGDRIGQIIIMPYPVVHFEEVEELSKTRRGTGGYGSTGR